MPDLSEKMQLKKNKILSSSLELFTEKGYINTSTRDIIDRTGYGASTFYRYFNSREEILDHLLSDFLGSIIQRVYDYYAEEKDLYQRFIETKRVILDVFIENPEMAEIYSRAAGTSPAIDKCLQSFDDRFLKFSSQNIHYGIEKGVFKNEPVPPIAHAILAMIKFAVYKWIVRKELSPAGMTDMVLSFHETLAVGMLKSPPSEDRD